MGNFCTKPKYEYEEDIYAKHVNDAFGVTMKELCYPKEKGNTYINSMIVPSKLI